MATIRDNVVVVKAPKFKSVRVIEGSLVATDGQPIDQRIACDFTGDLATFHVRSGRKKSKPIADKFMSASGSKDSVVTTHWGFSGEPEKLNFMFSVEVELEDNTKTVLHLAQGSTGVRNNWWIGGEDIRGGQLQAGGQQLKVEPCAIKDEAGTVIELAGAKVPAQFKVVFDFVGKTLFKELLKDVNVFKIS